MIDPQEPMNAEELRRLMSDRSGGSLRAQRRIEAGVEGSRLAFAIATVVANRNAADWAWLDQDAAWHRP